MNVNILRIVGLTSILLIILILAIIRKNNKNSLDIGMNSFGKRTFRFIWLKIYSWLSKIYIIKQIVHKIRLRLIMVSDSQEDKIREDSVKIFLAIYLPITGIILFSIFAIKKWYIVLILIFAFASISAAIIDMFISSISNQLLLEMIDFNEMLRKKYMHYKMIDEAFYTAIEELDDRKYRNIIRHANRIYEILISSNSEHLLNEFYLNAPNKHLKLLAGISHLTKEYGDNYKDNSSLFANSLNQISGEIRQEVLIKRKLSVALNTLYMIILIPVFSIVPIRMWAGNSFFSMKQFYDSPLGMISELSVLFIVLICFVLLRGVQNMNEIDNEMYRDKPFYKTLYDKFRRIIDYFIPAKSSKRYKKTQSLLRKAMYFGRVEWHYTDKLFKMLLSVVVSSVFVVVFINNSMHSLMYNPVIPRGFIGGEMSVDMKKEAVLKAAIDREIISEILENKTMKAVERKDFVRRKLVEKYEFDRDFVNIDVDRIIYKILEYESLKFNFKYIIFVYITGFIGYFIPDMFMKIKIAMIKIDIKSEVVKFQMLIGILMYVKNMSVDSILEWLERFSYIYKAPLQKAIMNYDSGARKSLEDLKEISDYDEFKKLVDHLIYSIEELSIIDSFAELESEKIFYREKRKEENLSVVEKKINMGKIIGFMPTYALILLYFVVPLIYVSIKEMSVYLSIIK